MLYFQQMAVGLIIIISTVAIIIVLMIASSTMRGRSHLNRPYTSGDAFATDKQLAYIRILGGHPSSDLTMVAASRLIDKLIEKRDEEEAEAEMQRERERQERLMAKESAAEEKRRQKEADAKFKRCKREEDELRMLADAESSPDYRPKKSRSMKVQTMREFQHLVNGVILDNVIDGEEVEALSTWLKAQKRLDGEFDGAIAILTEASQLDEIDDETTQKIYVALLDCLSQLRKRPVV